MQTKIKPKKINALLINSGKAEALVSFYRDLLGIPLEEERHGSDLHWGCDFDGLHFAIHQVPAEKAGPASIAISFEVDGVDELFNELKEQGVEIESEPEDRPFGRLAGIRDPDGNLVYLHAYPK